ncbi:MAG TPA: DUF937 domain-containing protein [Methylocella sp.]|nr:DUF937 domain-containing protein [Methylocella sp.]
MDNLYEILRNAQGGQAIDNLAAQFNITAGEAEAAVKAIVPELSQGLLQQASKPLGFGSFFGALGEDQHVAAFTDPAAAQDTATAVKGADLLSQVLGSHAAREEIALRAASATGINSDLLTQMLPVIASMIFGGLKKSMESQGFGGILGQLANAAGQSGGLGPILGQILGGGTAPSTSQQQTAPAPGQASGPGGLGSILGQILSGGRSPAGPGQVPAGGLGGILGSILGNLASRSGAGPAAGSAAPTGGPQVPGFDPASIQASLEALTKMLQPGTQPSPPGQPQGGIQAEISDIMSGKRH